MALEILHDVSNGVGRGGVHEVRGAEGTPLENQLFTWRELSLAPYSKLDEDAWTRVRIICVQAMDAEAMRFSLACARANPDLRLPLACVRRVEEHQRFLVGSLHPPDLSFAELTVAIAQASVEMIAAVAVGEPDPSLARVYRFAVLEELDHLYRFAALLDRIEGRDVNNLLQCQTDVVPGRPLDVQHTAPSDDLHVPYARGTAHPLSKLHVLFSSALAQHKHEHLVAVAPMSADPVRRQLYAEVASVEEQHITQFESLADGSETWLERWLLHEACEVFCAWSCLEYEKTPRFRAIWERLLEQELGHLAEARRIFEDHERRDAAEILPARFSEPISFESHRPFLRQLRETELELRAHASEFVPARMLSPESPSMECARALNAGGSPSNIAAAGWRFSPGTELVREDHTAYSRRTSFASSARRRS